MCVTGLDPAPMTTSWTTVLTFTSLILGVSSCAPSTPTRQAIGSSTRCANLCCKDVVKERKGVMATRESTDWGIAQNYCRPGSRSMPE